MRFTIFYSPGFRAFILETPDRRVYFDDDPDEGPGDLLGYIRRMGEKSTREKKPESLDAATVERLKAEYLAQGGTISGTITSLDLDELEIEDPT